MPDYPYCEIQDVQARNQQRPTYSDTSNPTKDQVLEFINNYATKLESIVNAAGYDINNIHQISSTVAATIAQGTYVDVNVTTGEGQNFEKGNDIKIEGLTSGIKNWEFDEISNISGDTITVKTIDNDYDSNSVTVKKQNSAMRILRDLNAIGAAHETEKSAFMGASPNRSEHAEALMEQYLGSEETQDGIWAISNIPNYLIDATITIEALEELTISSYGSEHEDDEDVQAVFTKDMDL